VLPFALCLSSLLLFFVLEFKMDISFIYEQAHISVYSFIAFWLFYLLSDIFFLQFSFYKKLSAADKVEWGSRVVSDINALYVTYGAVKSILVEKVWDENPFTGYSWISDYYHRVFVGYIAYDLILVFLHASLRSKSTILHHVVAIFAYPIGLVYHNVQMLTNAYLATEATTPFVNNRWFLAATKLTHTRTYILNGLLMTLGFLVIRVILVPYTSAKALANHWEEAISLKAIPQFFMFIILPTMTLLNTYWTLLMLRGLFRHLGKARRQHDQ